MRKAIQLLVALMLVGGSLAATLATINMRDFELRGYVDATKNQNLPFTVARHGVNVELTQYSRAGLTRALEAMRNADFRWIRQFAYWDALEPAPGDYEWSAWDRLAEALRDFPELEPVAVLMNSPAWARGGGASPATATAPPRSLADFAAFCRAFAERYGDVIDFYQVWDEPNLGDAWGGSEPRAADYVALLAAARGGLLHGDPSARIVAAALAPTVETGGRNISDIRYLEALYAHGARELMDVVAGKPYGFDAPPLDRRVDESRLNFSRIIALREIMLANGDGRKPLWASHYGWNALPGGWQGDASIWGDVSEKDQIQFTLQALDRAHREWPWLGAMFLQHWQPAATSTSAQWGFALVQRDGAASPLLSALQAYDFPALAQDGLHQARSRHARYSGVWRFSALGADIGWLETSDSQLAFDFYGRDVAMLLREDDYFAFLYPTVDGQAPNALQKDAAGEAYILLRSNTRAPETSLVPIAADLPLGRHTLRARADRGWDRWAIVGYAVSSGDLSAPYNRQIALGALATALSLLVFGLSVASAPWGVWLPAVDSLLTGLGASTQLLLASLTSVFMMLAMLWTWESPRASIFAREDENIALALLTGGALYVSEGALLTLALAFLLFVQVYHRLANGLILTLFWAPFFLWPLELFRYAIPMVEAVLLISAAAAFAKALVSLGRRLQMDNAAYPAIPRDWPRRIATMDIAVLILALLAIASLLWAEYAEVARTELRTLIIEPVIFYVLLRMARLDRKTLFRCFAALALAGVAVCLMGFYDLFLGAGQPPLKSVYGSPNNVGLLLGRALPLALAFVLVKVDARLRWLAAGSLALMLGALLLTQSLGAILLGAPAGLGAVILGRYGKKSLGPLVAAALVAIIAVALIAQASPRVAGALDFSSGTGFVRLRLWESAISMLRDKPLTGLGLDQFLYFYGGEYLRPDAIWDADLSHPHNFILDFWTRLTALGVAMFALMQVLFWRRTRSLLRSLRQSDPLLLALTLGLCGSMAALLAHGAVDNSVFVIDLAFIFMFQLAAIMSLARLGTESET